MSNNQKLVSEVVLKVGADKASLDGTTSEIKKLGDTVTQEANKASEPLAKLGDTATKTSEKVDRATKSMIAAIQRSQAEIQSVGRGTSDYFERIAQIKGIDAGALTPYINQLKAAEAAQRAAKSSLDGMGMSAKATSAALRQLPAQFTDIVVSLQGGQAPLTVLLQQGGQLKDVFGGVGAAARAFGGYVAGLVNPITVTAAAVGTLGYAAYSGAEELQSLNKALIETGGRSGVTSGQLIAAAQGMKTFGVTQGAATEALVQFANAGVEGADALQYAATAAIAWEKATGQAIEKTVAQYKELRKSPLETTLKLNENLGYMTEALYKQIKALEDNGKATEAADLAQKAYADTLKNRADEIVQNLGLIEKAWNGVKNVAKAAWDDLKKFGRDIPLEEQIAALQKGKEELQKQGRNVPAAFDDQLKVLTKRLMLQRDSAQLQAQEIARAEALAQADKIRDKFLGKNVQMEKEIADWKEKAKRAGLDQAAIEETIGKIKAKYAEKPKEKPTPKLTEVDRAYMTSMEELDRIQRKAEASTQDLSKTQEALRKIMGSPEWAQFTRRKQEEIIMAASLAQASEDEEAKKKLAEKSLKEVTAARDADIRKMKESADSALKKALQLEDEVALYGMSEEAITELTIARLRDEQAKQMSYGDDVAVKAIQDEIDALRRLAKARDSLRGKDEAKKAADKAVTDWQRAAERIQDSITDALMRGFENGKGFAENMRDTIVNMFKSMVLRPIIQAIVAPFAMGAATGASAGGIGGAAGGLQQLSLLDTLSKTYSTISGGFEALGKTVAAFSNDIGELMVLSGNKSGWSLINNSGAIGTGASYLGGAAAGYGIGMGISGKYSAFGDDKQDTAVLIGTGIGAAIGGPIGAAIGGSLGGLVNRAFGQGSKEYVDGGITGTFNADYGSNVSGYSDWKRDGGWFTSGSSGREMSAVNSSLRTYLSSAIVATTQATRSYATAVGLSADAVNGYSKSITISLQGLDEKARQAAIEGSIAAFGDSLTQSVYGEALKAYQRESETAAQTLVRLGSSITSVNAWLSMLRQRMYQVGLAGADAASKLSDLFGGLENTGNALKAYYDAFFTSAEKAADSTQRMASALDTFGISLPQSKEAFRALAESLDLNTDSGRKAYATLIALAPEFAQTTDAMAAAARESAQQLLAAYTGVRITVPALDTSALTQSVNNAGQVLGTLNLNGFVNNVQGSLAGIAVPPLNTAALIQSISAADAAIGGLDFSSVVSGFQNTVGALTIPALNTNPITQSITAANQVIAGFTLNPVVSGVQSALDGISIPTIDTNPLAQSVAAANQTLAGVNINGFVSSLQASISGINIPAIDTNPLTQSVAAANQTLAGVNLNSFVAGLQSSISNINIPAIDTSALQQSIAAAGGLLGAVDISGLASTLQSVANAANGVSFTQFAQAVQSLGTSAAEVDFSGFRFNLEGLSSGLFDASGKSVGLKDAIASMGVGLYDSKGNALTAAQANTVLAQTLTDVWYTSGGFTSSIVQLNKVMGDAGSGFVYYSDSVNSVSGAMTSSQIAALGLNSQIDALRSNADRTRIDFQGLGQALAGVNTTTLVSTLQLAFESLATRIKGVLDNITGERIAVREAALQIINPTVMSRAAILGQIGSINTALPSNAALNAALGTADFQAEKLSSLQSQYTAASNTLLNYQKSAADFKATTVSAVDEIHALADTYSAWPGSGIGLKLSSVYAPTVAGLNDDAFRYNASTNRLDPFLAYGGESVLGIPDRRAAMVADPKFQQLQQQLLAANSNFAMYEQLIAVSTAGKANAAANVAAQQSVSTAANAAAAQAATDYANALQAFSVDASKSVTKLSRLREETVKYYEEQKKLADLMQVSAAGLRKTVADYRYAQLSPDQQAAQLQAQFSSAYSLALSSQGDGATMSGYADKLNNLLPSLIEKLGEVGKANLVESYLSQAEAIAKLLEDNAPKNYQAESLDMLGAIDTTLALLEQSTQTAERVISDAVKAGADKTAEGLRAVVRALGGTPAFATGGYHSGGLRLVGENGPEMEVTGPSRIFNAAQTRAILSKGGDVSTVTELRALREEVAMLRSENMSGHAATASYTGKTARLLDRMEVDGMPVKNVADAPLSVATV